MPRFKIRRHHAVWETEEFTVEAASPEDVRARYGELYDEALDDAQITGGDAAGLPDEVEVFAADDTPCSQVLAKFDPDVEPGECDHELEKPDVSLPEDTPYAGLLHVRCVKCGEFGDVRRLRLRPSDVTWPPRRP